MPESLLRIGTVGSCFDVNMEDLSETTNLPFYALQGEKIEIVSEASKAELVSGAEKRRKERAKHIKVYYQGVMNTKGWIHFKTSSQYTPGKRYTQYIRLNESKDFKHFKEFNKRDIVRLFMFGDISVHCTCPDYRYKGYKYMGNAMGYGIFKESRFPKIRNPKLEGTVCKHILAVLGVYGGHWTSIAKDMTKTKFWKKRYDD